ncbi:MAG TPA: HAMP domain-containing sensor histidine kinase [Nitrolancea sp.]
MATSLKPSSRQAGSVRRLVALVAPLLLPPLVTLVLVLVLAHRYLAAGRSDLLVLAMTLAASGLVAWILGTIGLSILRAGHWGDLWTKVFIPAMIGVLTALVSIMITARLMFLSSHDLILLTLLLVFSLAVSAPFAMLAARLLADRVAIFGRAAASMSEGRLDTRVPVDGTDELDRLALLFNQMATRLEEASLQQIEAEDARRQLIAAISHDLRTPLSSIQAMVEAIEDDVVDGETARFYLSQILVETRGLGLMINDLFELAQIDAGSLRLQIERNGAAMLVADALDTMQPKAEQKAITLRRLDDVDDLVVLADSSQIQRVFYNLVDNALRHTPSGGSVMIDVADAGQNVVFSVVDSGPGIDPGDLPHVFERFYRADRSRHTDGGAGLGLAIARGIVEAHGGRIWADGSENGARFSFALPKPIG